MQSDKNLQEKFENNAMTDGGGDKFVIRPSKARNAETEQLETRTVIGRLCLHFEMGVGQWFHLQELSHISPEGYYDWKGHHNLRQAESIRVSYGETHPDVINNIRKVGGKVFSFSIDYFRVYPDLGYIIVPHSEDITFKRFLEIAQVKGDCDYVCEILTRGSRAISV